MKNSITDYLKTYNKNYKKGNILLLLQTLILVSMFIYSMFVLSSLSGCIKESSVKTNTNIEDKKNLPGVLYSQYNTDGTTTYYFHKLTHNNVLLYDGYLICKNILLKVDNNKTTIWSGNNPSSIRYFNNNGIECLDQNTLCPNVCPCMYGYTLSK